MKINMAETSPPEQFSLRWNNFSSSITAGFFSHLTENVLVDVTLAVEGQLLRAHKLVLSVCSPYFKNIFKEIPCQHPVIILKDMKYTEIESLLKFMYQGEININQEDLPTFLTVAQTLQIRGLTAEDTSSANAFPIFDSQLNIDPNNSQNIAQSNVSRINKTSYEMDAIDRRKRTRDVTKKSSKRRKQETTSLTDDTRDLCNKMKHEDDQDRLLLIHKDISDTIDKVEDVDISTEKSDDKDDNAIELTDAVNVRANPAQQDVEPVIYKLSARGRPQLVHEGYVYNLTSRSEGLNRSHYRCAEQHRGCKGKCAVIAERFMPTGVHDHNHPPGY